MRAFPLALLFCAAALPAQKTFSIELVGGQESPAVTTAGIGTASVVLDTTTGQVTVTGSYQNLSSDAFAAHIHGAARRGATAPPIVTLSITGNTDGTISGGGTLSPAQVQDVLDGRTYINVHTANHGPGEIRGQIDTVPGSGAPTSAAPTITGGAGPAQTLTIGCPPSTGSSWVLFGIALPECQTVPFPFAACGGVPVNIGFDLRFPFLSAPGTMVFPLPPNVPRVHVAFQCLIFDSATPCLTLSAASRVQIEP